VNSLRGGKRDQPDGLQEADAKERYSSWPKGTRLVQGSFSFRGPEKEGNESKRRNQMEREGGKKAAKNGRKVTLIGST